ncbi:MAG: acyl-CoA dehydrogenase family protein, partial [Planctomycetota bacterium]
LTTSRQHLAKPVLTAEVGDGGIRLNGFSPWVTSAHAADVIVMGATLVQGGDKGTQVLVALERETEGVEAEPGADLVALSSSCTDQVRLQNVFVPLSRIVDGPVENVLQRNSGGGAGGLQTSTLALGLSVAASDFLIQQAASRSDLDPVASKIQDDADELCSCLRQLNIGASCGVDAAELRQRANSLVLRSTQAALSAAKGAGFVASHKTGRWAREALFFLVWSCPQTVVNANLCELAQIDAN